MIRPRILVETDEISLYMILGLAMQEGLDLREVIVSYSGCGSHEVVVLDMSGDHAHDPDPVQPADFGHDPEVGF